MTKDESLVMKGVAILLMLFLHLFNQMANVELTEYYFSIFDKPLVYVLTRATNPVSFFIILSGYGLYISHTRGAYKVWHKMKSLYIHYWLTLLIFVSIGYYVKGGDEYPGTLVDVINNITGWDVTYNGEIWFLFPYVLVMLTSGWIIRILDRHNPWICLGVTFFVGMCTGFLISRYGNSLFYHNQLAYKPILYLQFLFSFAIGAYMAKYKLVTKLHTGGGKYSMWLSSHTFVYWILLLLLVTVRCCFDTSALNGLYVFAFIILFINAPRSRIVDRFLMEMGRRSTSMWFVHSYFCYYIFQDFIYGFRYPVVIFIVLISVSYASAVVIDSWNMRIQRMISKG